MPNEEIGVATDEAVAVYDRWASLPCHQRYLEESVDKEPRGKEGASVDLVDLGDLLADEWPCDLAYLDWDLRRNVIDALLNTMMANGYGVIVEEQKADP